MKIEGNLGKAMILPAVVVAAIFAPQTLLFAAGMYAVGSLAGAYLEAASANAAEKIRKGYEDGYVGADLLEGAGHLGNSFVRTASMFCPVVPLVAFAAGKAMNKRTYPNMDGEHAPRMNREAVLSVSIR